MPTDLNVGNWRDKAQEALVVFNHALAYDVIKLQVVTASGQPCETACQMWPFLGAPITTDKALFRALGLLDINDGHCDLPPVNVLDNGGMESRLTEDMIEGASLPPLPWPEEFRPTIQVEVQTCPFL